MYLSWWSLCGWWDWLLQFFKVLINAHSYWLQAVHYGRCDSVLDGLGTQCVSYLQVSRYFGTHTIWDFSSKYLLHSRSWNSGAHLAGWRGWHGTMGSAMFSAVLVSSSPQKHCKTDWHMECASAAYKHYTLSCRIAGHYPRMDTSIDWPCWVLLLRLGASLLLQGCDACFHPSSLLLLM